MKNQCLKLYAAPVLLCKPHCALRHQARLCWQGVQEKNGRDWRFPCVARVFCVVFCAAKVLLLLRWLVTDFWKLKLALNFRGKRQGGGTMYDQYPGAVFAG